MKFAFFEKKSSPNWRGFLGKKFQIKHVVYQFYIPIHKASKISLNMVMNWY